jgi:hypothetical protein
MAHGRALALALSGAILAVVGGAGAAPKVQAVAETSVGYSDNIQSAPDDPPPGIAERSNGAFVMASPGLVLAAATQAAIHRLRYTYTYTFFIQETDASASSNQLDYRGFFDLSPRVLLVVGATAIQTNSYSAVLITPPGLGVVNALPTGGGAFLSLSADELMAFDLAPGWRAYQGVRVAEQTPIFDGVGPRTFAPGARVGLERSFEIDAVGAELRADYTAVEGSLLPDGTPAGVQRQVIAAGVATWRHDWGRFFSSRAELGALRVQRLNSGRVFWAPVGGAALAYIHEYADAELSYAHTVTTNLLLGQTLVVDEVRLQGGVPLTKKGEVLAGASAGYQRGRILNEDAELATRVEAILLDVGIGWQVTPNALLGLRYQHMEQMSEASVPPLPLSFVRNTVMAGAVLKFPPESDMPRAYRSPRRVDASDEIRDGFEPNEVGGPERRK